MKNRNGYLTRDCFLDLVVWRKRTARVLGVKAIAWPSAELGLLIASAEFIDSLAADGGKAFCDELRRTVGQMAEAYKQTSQWTPLDDHHSESLVTEFGLDDLGIDTIIKQSKAIASHAKSKKRLSYEQVQTAANRLVQAVNTVVRELSFLD